MRQRLEGTSRVLSVAHGYRISWACVSDQDHKEWRHKIYDIFEGTEQIQQLVIARAISGLRIE